MSLLLALQLAPDPPQPTTGQLLRSSGIRRPWMPGVLAGPGADPIRQTAIVAVIATSMALPGASVWMPHPLDAGVVAPQDRPTPLTIQVNQPPVPGGQALTVGRLPRAEDTSLPARPAMVVQQPVPVPGANVEQTYAPRDQAVVQPDHTWPFVPIVGWQPVPVASFWMPSPARLPNADPLRPPIVLAKPPDGTLAQPSALLIGRLARTEDTSRPARPAVVQTGAQPVPGAQALPIGVVHETPAAPSDRLPPGTGVIVGGQPVPGASALFVGAVKAAPIDRLALTQVISGQPPLPAGRALWTFAPRDQVVAAADRLACTQVVSGQQPQPLGRALSIGIVHADDRALVRTPVVRGPQPQPGAVAAVVGRITSTPTDPLRPAAILVSQPPIPQAAVVVIGPSAGQRAFVGFLTHEHTIVLAARGRSSMLVGRTRSAAPSLLRMMTLAGRTRLFVLAARDRSKDTPE